MKSSCLWSPVSWSSPNSRGRHPGGKEKQCLIALTHPSGISETILPLIFYLVTSHSFQCPDVSPGSPVLCPVNVPSVSVFSVGQKASCYRKPAALFAPVLSTLSTASALSKHSLSDQGPWTHTPKGGACGSWEMSTPGPCSLLRLPRAGDTHGKGASWGFCCHWITQPIDEFTALMFKFNV